MSVKKSNVYINDKLFAAVVDRLGGTAKRIGDAWEVDDYTASVLRYVSRNGASGGVSGFIYYSTTWEFFRENRAEIREQLEQMADGLGEGCAVDLVRGFNCFRDDTPTADEVGRLLWGSLPLEWSEGSDIDANCVANACAWFALEEVANAWYNADEINDDENEEEGGAE